MRRFGFAKLMLWLGLLFIYLPMIIMVIYSFNASKLVTVWGGWSLKWYFGLLDNKQLIGSVFRSLEIAFYTAIKAQQDKQAADLALWNAAIARNNGQTTAQQGAAKQGNKKMAKLR